MDQAKYGTDMLRCLAIIMIINSHMDVLYPIPEMATGGAIGNAVFFMLSAYGISLSDESNPKSFSVFMGKRISRIYPPVWSSIVFIIIPLIIINYYESPESAIDLAILFGLNDPLTAIGIIFYPPTQYWFLCALMLYYVIGFFAIKLYDPARMLLLLAPAFFLYVIFYIDISDYSRLVIEQQIKFKLVFYYGVFMFGIYLAKSRGRSIIFNGSGIFYLVLLFVSVLVFYGHKLLMAAGYLMEYQFVQHIMIFPIILSLICLLQSKFIHTVLDSSAKLKFCVGIISAMTLELYLTHGPIRGLVLRLGLSFPLSVLSYVVIVVVYSYVLHSINSRLSGSINMALTRIEGRSVI
jgi:hypothetical protein